MRPVRRSLAFLLNLLLLLQLSVVGAGAACTRALARGTSDAGTPASMPGSAHDSENAESHHAASAHAAHAAAASAGPADAGGVGGRVGDRGEQSSPDSPRNMEHCATAAGCAAFALASAELALSPGQTVRTHAAPTRADAPRALVAAPEPPPPRG